ncbi:hypothetical protein [Klebsiella pneumoniae]|uniref:hypothetical protein n=1 Tax=Klebsiella pneumoniae TaxID=573 RepID=UPI003526D687
MSLKPGDMNCRIAISYVQSGRGPLGFIDDPGNTDFAALLNAAEARKTIQLYVELPNKRTATMLLALSGWQMNEIAAPANEVIQITVQGKQNKITWGTVAVSGGA